ncbi:TonB-dependent receptor [Filimonas effusa]|uniref:TonB-dependent receptor n=1 Tax=Filimonas effusa TaxID=2508721 RepID=A0A4Q1DD28_9BACT|nr:TonB-dependent receptor [Filimonas effusa]RXK87290.1 TonB-dependent receptor [Filimonas effusa]
MRTVMARILCLLTGVLFLFNVSYAQSRYTVSGVVKSKKNGESLIGASVRVVNGKDGVVTNDYGFFSMTLPAGSYDLEISAVGLQPYHTQVDLKRNITLDIQLQEIAQTLEEVKVTASPRTGRSLTSTQMGVERLTMDETKNIPVLMGERDVLKTIQLLPGIKSAGEGSSGFFVRGGAADQNLILLDEAPVYNASHMLGFFSTFNSDAIKDINVYKGGMPAQYGGRLSSVLDIKMNEGNNQDYDVAGSVGLISAKANVEGPIQKDKSSFLVSGRRTYLDLFLKASSDSSINQNTLYFYDLNAKMNYTLGKKDRLYLSGYFGRDKLGVGETFKLNWGNATATARWNHIFNSRLFSNTSFIFSNYDYKISIRSGSNDFNVFSQIRDFNIKEELQWYASNRHTVRVGVNFIHHTMRPGEITANSSESGINDNLLQRRYSWENAAYISDVWKLSDKLNVSYGVRGTMFRVLGEGDFYNINANGNVTDTFHYAKGEVVKTYYNLEPRVAASLQLNSSTSLKTSYVRNVQNLHLISNSTSSSPTDKWVASTNIIKPEVSDQVSLGYYKNLVDNQYELTVEAYYKTMQNQVDYRDGADVFNNDAIESQLLFGKGRAYGIEWLLKKKAGRFSGWLSYTLSKTERKIDGINKGQWYNARQDRTHDIAIVGTYKLNEKWTFSANWVYYTGDAITFPSGKYRVDGQVVFYYTERNGYRMPAYHRLDLGATLQLKKTKRFSSELAFSLYNAYGRENAYTIEFREAEDNPNKTEAVRVALFKFVPSISYNFKF